MIKTYLKKISDVANRGDDREESYYSALEKLIEEYAESAGKSQRQDSFSRKHYCKIVTALEKTIAIQKDIDKLYPKGEADLLEFSSAAKKEIIR